ncbi:MAG: 16S rRNA (cytidine(1402)-2'-O)-methyltransferase [Candidatus Paceibacterota bacterium]|jgi:16S rRNA (cytidine1402-2'-O)-methyltransferase
MSKFYVVGTPIGNLEDITYRAVRILGEVDLVLCEDTRVTRVLLDRYGIKTPTMSYHAQSKISKADKIIELLNEGKNLALVSDAGTPTISDPGSLLVSQIKQACPEVEIIAVPGPSAVVAALSISGVSVAEFTFLGFLPHKKGRETLFKEIAASERLMAFYESPHRIIKTLESLNKFAPDKKVIIARELTKIYEQIVSGSVLEVQKYFNDNPDKVRGEFVVIVSDK